MNQSLVQNAKKRLVSIVLPVYNGEAMVSRSIESVLQQTYPNLELIIVNDCSTDNTPQIIEKYASLDSRVKIINNSVNLKLPRSLNVGFENALGYYYTWTSDDNFYKSSAIQRMIETLEANPDADMVYADFSIVDTNENILRTVKTGSNGGIYRGNQIGACFLYTKNIADKVGEYDPKCFLAEDFDYWIRLFRAGKALHLPENLYFYRRHDKSLSSTKTLQIQKVALGIIEKNFMYLYSHQNGETEKLKFLEFFEYFYLTCNTDKNEIRKTLCAINPLYKSYMHVRYTLRYIKYKTRYFLRNIKHKLINFITL